MVKNPLVMRETWVQSLGWEDPLEGPPGASESKSCNYRSPRTLEPTLYNKRSHRSGLIHERDAIDDEGLVTCGRQESSLQRMELVPLPPKATQTPTLVRGRVRAQVNSIPFMHLASWHLAGTGQSSRVAEAGGQENWGWGCTHQRGAAQEPTFASWIHLSPAVGGKYIACDRLARP